MFTIDTHGLGNKEFNNKELDIVQKLTGENLWIHDQQLYSKMLYMQYKLWILCYSGVNVN